MPVHAHLTASGPLGVTEVGGAVPRGSLMVFVRDDREPGYEFALAFSPAGRLLAMTAAGKGEAQVTARLLRRVAWGQYESVARQRIRREAAAYGAAPAEPGQRAGEDVSYMSAIARDFASAPRPGRRGRGDVAYAAVAATYVGSLGAGRAVQLTASELGYSPSQVRNLLYEARRRGLLTDSPAGREGGELTDKARALLADEEG